MNSPINGKWALVTGSSRGIGQQIAKGLASYGCNVVVHGRKPESSAATLKMLKTYDVQSLAVAGELSSEEGIRAVVAGVAKAGVEIDILYNNAAISSPSTPILEAPLDLWKRTFQVNLWAMIELVNAFAPGMVARKWGRIINLTSGIADQPNLAPYSVSKAAVDKYSRDLAVALKPHNILVNYIDPGWLKTDLGGPNAFDKVETVLPGALVPALLPDDGPTGKFYAAQDYKVLGR